MTNKQRFILFLKEKNIYTQFMASCMCGSKTIEKNLYEYVRLKFNDMENPFFPLIEFPYTSEEIELEWKIIWREKMGNVFCAFLRENNAYEAFQSQIRRNFQEYLTNRLPSLYISGAFDWKNTSEGYDFWKDIDHKWLEIEKMQHYPNTQF